MQDYQLLLQIIFYLTIVTGMVTASGAIVGGIAFWKADRTAETFSLLLHRINLLQMLTVVLIIMAACGLRLSDKISGEVVGSLLSGIAGFVLGGVSKSRSRQGEDKRSQ